jgi:hypothetical protein
MLIRFAVRKKLSALQSSRAAAYSAALGLLVHIFCSGLCVIVVGMPGLSTSSGPLWCDVFRLRSDYASPSWVVKPPLVLLG